MTAAVALDARSTSHMSVGMTAYVRELTSRLPRVAPDLRFAVFSRGDNFGWNEHVGLPYRILRARVDVTHFMTPYMPLWAPRPYVVTIHDLIHLRFPQFFKRRVGPYYRFVVAPLCARAASVITDDERTIDDLERLLHVDRAKVRAIPLGVNDRFLEPAKPYGSARPYILYVGNHRPHKDLPTLFAAWAALPTTLAADLYVTGPDDFGMQRAGFFREEGRIVPLGDVSEGELASYYAGAAALAHPSLCEGFGLPLLEAMACGCPVVACEDAVPAPLRAAALTFRAGDVDGLRGQLQGLLTSPPARAALADSGKNLARALTWDRCAERTAQVYREVVEGR